MITYFSYAVCFLGAEISDLSSAPNIQRHDINRTDYKRWYHLKIRKKKDWDNH